MLGFNSGVRVISAIFRETGAHNDQFRRHWTTMINDSHIRHVAAVTSGASNVTPMALASISSQIMRPAAEPDKQIWIPNGFAQSRFRFIITLLVAETSMSRTRKILIGYTDHPGASVSTGNIDPGMIMYLNNVITITDTFSNGMTNTVVRENDQILTGLWEPSLNNANREYMLRPEDVVRGMGVQSMINTFASDQVFDYGSTFANGVSRANRQNTLPSMYLANVINAGMLASTMDMDSFGTNQLDVVANNASTLLTERTVHEDPVLQQMHQMASSFRTLGCISVGEMCAIFPELNHVAEVAFRKPENFSPIIDAAGSQGWNSLHTETMLATQLANLIPSIMMDCLLARARFVITNMNVTGEFTCIPNDEAAFLTYAEGVDAIQQFLKMAHRLRFEVHPGISEGGTMPYYIEILCEPMNDIQMSININGMAMPFLKPCFCDGLSSMLVTSNQMQLPQMSKDFGNLVNNVVLMKQDAQMPAPQIFTGKTSLW